MKKHSARRKFSNVFFIIAFTFAFLAFSMGYSALSSQKEKLLKYDSATNKSLRILGENIKSDEIVNAIKDKAVTIQLRRSLTDKKDNSIYEVTTEIKSDGFTRIGDLRYGKYLSKEDYNSDSNIGVFSNGLNSEDSFNIINNQLDGGKEYVIKEFGRTFDTESYIDVTNGIFFKIANTKEIGDGRTLTIISGKNAEILSAIESIKEFVKDKDKNSNIEVYDFQVKDIETEGKAMFQMSFLIIVITIVNSISISYLWVEDNKRALTIRKVCGANNSALTKIFFGRLIVMAMISVCIALLLQYIIGIIFKGIFFNLDIRITLNNAIISFMVSIGVAFLSSLPALFYINKLQPATILKGE